jgi:hypothetical protein
VLVSGIQRADKQRSLAHNWIPANYCGNDGETSVTWKTLEEQQPELAAFGAERLNGRVAYLATVRKDGSPRVHPMTPIIGQGHFFVFMEPTSPNQLNQMSFQLTHRVARLIFWTLSIF